MRDCFAYTNMGGCNVNGDALLYSDAERLSAVVCGSLKSVEQGVPAFVAKAALGALEEGAHPKDALQSAARAWRETGRDAALLKTVTAAALSVKGGACGFAGAGDSRVYHFTRAALAHRSEDDSAAYEAYLRGEISYGDIRACEDRERLTASLGAGEPRGEDFSLGEGDGVLLCSDGFWEYIYEEEMYIDFLKAGCAKDWAELLLLRLAARSMLQGDNLSVFCYIHKGECEV